MLRLKKPNPIALSITPDTLMLSEKENRKSEPGGLRTVLITDAAATTALGDTLQDSWKKLLAGTTAIRPVARFKTEPYGSRFAACIEGLEQSDGRSRMRSLLDFLFAQTAPVSPDTLLVTATTKAGIENLERLKLGKPAEIQDIALASIARLVSERFRLTAEGFNISAACASSAIAVAHGAGLIALGRAESVLVCCIDLVSEFTFSGFSTLKALSPFPCKPFDRDRQGLSLGEGAAALLLMSEERARREKRTVLGKVLGWGVAGDAAHITAPDKEGCGLAQAISSALKRAGLTPEAVAAVSAHGTGTMYNDLMELTAFRKVFEQRKVPVYSVKGAVGHCLGAAGGIEVAVGLQALSSQAIPPTVGLAHPMIEAEGWVSRDHQPISGDCLLTANSGFGGINAALVLGREHSS